ncbi:hypothetical protein [Nocardia crassostreae]|uniref:hypothetical protein n=1 Tax=Nocardia crassostreae TaxID=53428 RepID=UPI0008334C06|nr:hypothetical protein [Nocardia crassostreae]
MSGAVMTLIIVLAAIAVLALLAVALIPRARSRRLRDRFGPEYDRTVQHAQNRRVAERALTEREKQHSQLDLRDLSEDEKRRYTMQWAQVQEQFIDDPVAALTNADHLVTAVMTDRGYPAEDYDQQLDILSVEHAQPLEQYRIAHDITGRAGQGQVTTEDMRTAIVHYRALFEDLMNGHRAESGTSTN